ncbi:DUF3717 domain-containing protein [Noviherbaspirillum sedimenti]|uniref:DUF3717 domain-containing protein n=1 Tax=Noviherbaspirillum sedimenti TaxID=2320865 RepID=A0A3A3G4D0_9BURK|nr:DUF3717 domain-containing protein [Noviherbaspirillum sedimenti]RJG02791.1 DUF3717 domain-containing protein [Noviherbaspirillum sedimenti]
MDISLPELEQAINYWRARKPSVGEECALSAEVSALARVYALMIYHRTAYIALAALDPVARQLIEIAINQQARLVQAGA